MPRETKTFTLPAFWACALINDDLTGLTDEDQEALDAWIIANDDLGLCVNVGEEVSFVTFHDAAEYVLACDCAEFTFEVLK